MTAGFTWLTAPIFVIWQRDGPITTSVAFLTSVQHKRTN